MARPDAVGLTVGGVRCLAPPALSISEAHRLALVLRAVMPERERAILGGTLAQGPLGTLDRAEAQTQHARDVWGVEASRELRGTAREMWAALQARGDAPDLDGTLSAHHDALTEVWASDGWAALRRDVLSRVRVDRGAHLPDADRWGLPIASVGPLDPASGALRPVADLDAVAAHLLHRWGVFAIARWMDRPPTPGPTGAAMPAALTDAWDDAAAPSIVATLATAEEVGRPGFLAVEGWPSDVAARALAHVAACRWQVWAARQEAA